MHGASGDGRGFALSGGVAEAVVNCIKEQYPDREVKVANAEGLADCKKLLTMAKAGKYNGYLLEGMACPGGCVGGGGQPIHDGEELAFARGRKLYALDAKADIRYSHENPAIREIYSDFFGKPMSHKAHMLLHTEHWKNN